MSALKQYGVQAKDENGEFTIDLTPFIDMTLAVDNMQRLFLDEKVASEIKAMNNWYIRIKHGEVPNLPASQRQFMHPGGNHLGISCKNGHHRLVRLNDKDWRKREAMRLKDGTYTPLPPSWAKLKPIADHFAHLSIEAEAMLAFTPDEAKGETDVQTRTKPGKYLTKYYQELSPDEVRELAVSADRTMDVKFAENADEMEYLYTHGPSSCMSYAPDSGQWNTDGVHPVRCYAGFGLAFAYIGNGHPILSKSFRATARCLTWPEKKIYGRIYGDAMRLQRALVALGYKVGETSAWSGMKLAAVPLPKRKNHYLWPYLDHHPGRQVFRKDHFELVSQWPKDYRPDDVQMNHGGGLIHVVDQSGWPICNGLGRRVDCKPGTMVEVYPCGLCCPQFVKDRTFFCAGRKLIVSNRHEPMVITADTRKRYSLSWAKEHLLQFGNQWYAGDTPFHTWKEAPADAEIPVGTFARLKSGDGKLVTVEAARENGKIKFNSIRALGDRAEYEYAFMREFKEGEIEEVWTDCAVAGVTQLEAGTPVQFSDSTAGRDQMKRWFKGVREGWTVRYCDRISGRVDLNDTNMVCHVSHLQIKVPYKWVAAESAEGRALLKRGTQLRFKRTPDDMGYAQRHGINVVALSSKRHGTELKNGNDGIRPAIMFSENATGNERSCYLHRLQTLVPIK